MKEKFVKNSIIALLSVVVLMYLLSKVVLADTAPIDLDSLQNIGEGTPSTSQKDNNVVNKPNNNAVVNKSNNNVTANTTNNNAVVKTTKIPQTGSNSEIVYIIGITVLIGTSIFVYKKAKF